MTDKQKGRLKDLLFNHHDMSYEDYNKDNGFVGVYFQNLCEYIDKALEYE